MSLFIIIYFFKWRARKRPLNDFQSSTFFSSPNIEGKLNIKSILILNVKVCSLKPRVRTKRMLCSQPRCKKWTQFGIVYIFWIILLMCSRIWIQFSTMADQAELAKVGIFFFWLDLPDVMTPWLRQHFLCV